MLVGEKIATFGAGQEPQDTHRQAQIETSKVDDDDEDDDDDDDACSGAGFGDECECEPNNNWSLVTGESGARQAETICRLVLAASRTRLNWAISSQSKLGECHNVSVLHGLGQPDGCKDQFSRWSAFNSCSRRTSKAAPAEAFIDNNNNNNNNNDDDNCCCCC